MIRFIVYLIFSITVVSGYKLTSFSGARYKSLSVRASTIDQIANNQLDIKNIHGRKPSKGSTPEFVLADDSTRSTPFQYSIVSLHYLLFTWNILSASQQLDFSDMTTLPLLLLSILGSIVIGDFGTGVFHWSVDNYGSINTPIFGGICAAFQGHHQSPWTITFRPFVNNVYKIGFGTIPALTLLALSNLNFNDSSHHAMTTIFLSLFINFWLLSQELHKYSHMKKDKIPKVIAWMQDRNIILSRKEHGAHHQSPFEGNYCIVNGICNDILDRMHFFRYLEVIVYKVTGNKPITWKEDPSIEEFALTKCNLWK